MPVTVGLLGDVMLGRGVAEELASMPPDAGWTPELRAVLAECDLVVANLECCVSDRGRRTSRIPGKPFFFRAPPSATACLRAIGVSAVSLANNHALDFEDEALCDTLRHLDAAGVAHAGAGPDVGAARRPAIVDAGGLRLAVVGLTDHPEEYAAGQDAWGVAWAELGVGCPRWVHDALAQARCDADLVLAFPHWGPNMVDRPAPWQRERARELLESGADLVAGHSAHVFHGVERMSRGTVLYDLGGAVDDYARHPVLRNELGMLALWRPEGEPRIELMGLRLDYACTGLAEGPDAEWVATRLRRACQELGTVVERVDANRFVIAR
jgi:poly-gamma-glutamate capsule biosynthesis protein CapA/YwtB (metallophosphatase superfamily)